MRVDSPTVIFCTCPDTSASTIAHALVEERLVACVNVVSGVKSVYRWEGTVNEDEESLLVLKTTTSRYEEVERRLLEIHPYDVPEVLGLPTCSASEAYVDWLRGAVSENH